MTRKHYEDGAPIRDGAWNATHTEGRSTTRRKGPKSATYKTHAIGEQAGAVEYLESCRSGEHGQHAADLLEEFMPLGLHMYPPLDQISCAGRIMARDAAYKDHPHLFGLTGEALKTQAAKDLRDLYGPD